MVVVLTAAEQNAIWNQVQREFECLHEHTRLAVKTKSNGSQNYREQCQACGAVIREIRKIELTQQQQRQAVLWNDNLMREWSSQRHERYMQLLDARRFVAEMVRRTEYNVYLSSPEWKLKRQKVMERSGGLCEGCRERKATDVHHLTYDRFRDEMLFDLVAICRECHNKIHVK